VHFFNLWFREGCWELAQKESFVFVLLLCSTYFKSLKGCAKKQKQTKQLITNNLQKQANLKLL